MSVPELKLASVGKRQNSRPLGASRIQIFPHKHRIAYVGKLSTKLLIYNKVKLISKYNVLILKCRQSIVNKVPNHLIFFNCRESRIASGLVLRVPGYRSGGPVAIPGSTRFSEK
jgi:hypothetical protein